MIVEQRPLDDIKKYLIESGQSETLKDSAAEMVASGITTMEEFDRITYFTD